MTKKKSFIAVVGLLVLGLLSLAVMNLTAIGAYAGKSETALSGESNLFIKDSAGEFGLNSRNYIIGGSGVEYAYDGENEKHTVKFTEKAGNRDILLFSEFPTVTDTGDAPSLNADIEFKIDEIKGDKTFGVMLGVQRLDSIAKSNGSGWLYFENGADGGYKYGLNIYSETGEETKVVENGTTESGEIKVHIEQFFGGGFTVSVNETALNVGDAELPAALIGLAQTGAYTDENNYATATLTKFDVKNAYYTSARTTNLREKFDAAALNAEEWYMSGLGIGVKDGKLNFDDASQSTFISTRYKYSNFEMKFDLTDLKRTQTLSETGGLVKAASSSFLMCFGIDVISPEAITGYDSATNNGGRWTRFDGQVYADGKWNGKTVVQYDKVNAAKTQNLSDDYNLWNPAFDGRVANVRIKMVDGLYECALKWADETDYETVVTYDMGNTPYGYIIFGGGWVHSGINGVNCSIDNLEIVNLDKDATLLEVGYTPFGLKNNGDCEYVDLRDPSFLLSARAESGVNGFAKKPFPVVQIVFSALFLAGAIALGTLAAVFAVKGKKTKGDK